MKGKIMDTQTFIQSVASGNAAQSKDILNDLLSSRAFEALDNKKVELSRNIFTGREESPVEVQDTEDTETAQQ